MLGWVVEVKVEDFTFPLQPFAFSDGVREWNRWKRTVIICDLVPFL